jgi:enterochelin esterase family protein
MAKIFQQTTNPQIKGNEVTWFYRGKQNPYLIGDFNFWNPEKKLLFTKSQDGSWNTHLEVPGDAYLEYAFLINEKRKLDPLNKLKVHNGLGEWNNFFYMSGFVETPYLQTWSGKPLFRTESHILCDPLRLTNGKRRVHFYIPAGKGPFPLLVIFDGQEYLENGKVIQIIEMLIVQGKIQPIAVALVDNIYQNRFIEYACNDGTVSFITRNVISAAKSIMPLLNTDEQKGTFGIMGASMGGLMALYSALREPGVFGKVICQAGAFKMYGDDFSIYEFVDGVVTKPLQIWMNVGCFDFLYEENLRMKDLLLKKGYSTDFVMNNGGHNYTTWRNSLPLGLMKMFPPKKKY